MLLLVEDDARLARACARALGRYQSTKIVGDLASARAALATTQSITGLIIDVFLPDGTGLDLLDEARAAGLGVPALLVSGHAGLEILEHCFRLDAQFLTKPVPAELLADFAKRTVHIANRATRAASRADLLAVAERWRARCRLTRTEYEILLAILEGESRESIALRRGCTFHTVRKHVGNLLTKVGYPSRLQLVRAIEAEAERTLTSG